MRKLLLITGFILSLNLQAQDTTVLQNQIKKTIDELREFISIPNDALEHADINRNITWLTQKFNQRGFNTSVLPTEEESLFFAALPMKDEKPTLLFYMHFDGQSVDPSKWEQANPYEVVLKAQENGKWVKKSFDALNDSLHPDWRLFGRSVSDDKGPIIMFLNTIDLLKASGKDIHYNIKVILDGQEEKGSKPLSKAVNTYKELLKADLLIIGDGPMHYSGKPTLVYGCRGITTMTLTTFGPVNPQHSGHYGNYAPNPAFLLADLLAGMKDTEGKVTIPGYYDGISLDENTLEILRAVPDGEEELKEKLQIGRADQVAPFYQAALQYPSLNIRGMSSGWVGPETRTIVPSTATAELDLRLVVESDGDRLKKLVRQYIRDQGFTIVDSIPDKQTRIDNPRVIAIQERPVTAAFRTPLDHPFGIFLSGILETEFQQPVVQIRTTGGTVPIAPFVNALQIPAFILPVVNPDNNQHSPNENLKLWQLEYGIRAFYHLLSTPMP